jgi:hypothetical protein
MRRNVRRLNREIGHVASAAGALHAVKSTPMAMSSNRRGGGGSSPPTLSLGQDTEYYPLQNNYNDYDSPDESGRVTQNTVSAMKKGGGRGGGRKAANLSELKRYFKAAEEAASEVLAEEMGTDGGDQVVEMTRVGTMPLRSPGRVVALQLANNNPLFREKLKRKLEETGGVNFQVEDLNRPDFIGEDKQVAGKGRGKSVNGKQSRGLMDNMAASSAAGNAIADKNMDNYVFAGVGQPQYHQMGDDSDDMVIITGKQPLKLRQKRQLKSTAMGSSSGEIADDSIMKRRRKTDLKIAVDTSKLKSNHDIHPTDTTPTQKQQTYRTRSTSHTSLPPQPPLSLISNFSAGVIESPSSVEKHVMFGSDMFSALVDTPTARYGVRPLVSVGNGSYDFDEVTRHFPSPRPGEALGASPNRWGSAQSAGSFGLGMGVFNFPVDATASSSSSSTSTAGIALHQNRPASQADGPPSVDVGAADIHAKKFKRVLKRDSHASSISNISDQSVVSDADALIAMASPKSLMSSPPLFIDTASVAAAASPPQVRSAFYIVILICGSHMTL